MEFWGVEVKSGEPLLVESGDEFFVHLSQACLGEVKKDRGTESVCLSVKINDKKIVLGTLSPEKFPHLSFDLVFHKDFELSHNWKQGSVFFSGYKVMQDDASDDESEPELEPEARVLPVATKNDAEGLQLHEGKVKIDPAGSKQKVKIVEPNKDDKPDEETDDSDDSTADEDDSSDEDDTSDDKDMANKGEDDESDDEDDESNNDSDESDEEDEETPTVLKTESGKKRSAVSAKKTPLPDKKAKLVTPQKTDTKKPIVHVATPHPSKKIVKTPVVNDQKKEQQSQKSFRCTSCNRSFGSEVALQSHSKAKHSAA